MVLHYDGDSDRIDFDRIDFDRIDFDRIDFDRIDFDRIDFDRSLPPPGSGAARVVRRARPADPLA
ncbi:hypothetical protein GCM10010451_57090 [Streptomyces virens]|uniref:Pentapeptide repeat-containing protein n=1 Tax=Streptomyces virens TaxID=285572 RepID=A0ABP6Q3D9_9ACTN